MLIAVVPSEGIAETRSDHVGPYFVAQAGVPGEFLFLPYGYIGRQPKGEGYINPWKLAEAIERGEVGVVPSREGADFVLTQGGHPGVAQGIGDDGVLRWRVAIGRSGEVTFSGSIDVADGSLAQLFQSGGEVVLPDAIVLVDRHDLGDVRAACGQLGIELMVRDYHGQLAFDHTTG